MGVEALKSRPESGAEETKTESGEGDEAVEDMRVQKRFNVKVWTPVLVNTATSNTAASSGATRAASSASESQVTTSTSTPLTPSAPDLAEGGTSSSEADPSELDPVDSSSTVSEVKTQ